MLSARKKAVPIVIVLLTLLLCSCSAPAKEASAEMEPATIVYVVDGDTLCVQRSSIQGPEKVRLIGINCPESVASQQYLDAHGLQNTQEGIDASLFVKSIVHQGDTVYLQYDREREDKYGRLLAYVWLEAPTNAANINEVSTKMLNGILLSNGFAETMSFASNTKYKAVFAKIEPMA